MGWRARSSLLCLAIVGLGFLARNAIAQTLLTFQAPHAVRVPIAVLDPAFGQRIDGEASRAKIVTADDLVTFSLRATASALHFGLGHATRLSFDGADREGNCVEYAELFGSIVNREHGSQDVHAWVVRSDARIMGKAVPNPAWRDHDWVLVLVHTPQGPRRLYVDPTLYDMGMGWDISSAVVGRPAPSLP
jgi:hypothetical protein